MLDHDFLEPHRLRAFVTVAETGSFTRAAERLHLTQPAISTQVRRLEEAVGRPLFERNAQAAQLTTDGEAMLGYARELLEVIGRARRQFAQPPLEGSVRFGMVEDFGTTALPSILGSLRQEHPHFELAVETGLGIDLVRRLEAGSLDLILTKRVAGQNEAGVLCRQNLVWVGQPGVLGADNNIVPLVLYPAPAASREIVLRTLRENDLRWSIRFESASITTLRAALLSGIGVGAFGIGMIPEGVHVLPQSLLPKLADTEYLLDWRPDCTDRVVSAFASILRVTAPLIIQRLVDEQSPRVLAAG
ncbi:MAG TPA: LysR family transcriptional regulator [Chthoniobacterales bacterium]|jgi:DNA-binding transcriptional LysR family regulator|nr:LysR family transcriptional regulator [Chthoniobacterales bacterium]